jgi:hypothetical protein
MRIGNTVRASVELVTVEGGVAQIDQGHHHLQVIFLLKEEVEGPLEIVVSLEKIPINHARKAETR